MEPKLEDLSDDELVAYSHRLMEERAAMEAEFKERQRSVATVLEERELLRRAEREASSAENGQEG